MQHLNGTAGRTEKEEAGPDRRKGAIEPSRLRVKRVDPLWGKKNTKQEVVPLERKSAIGETLRRVGRSGRAPFRQGAQECNTGSPALPEGQERHPKGKRSSKRAVKGSRGGPCGLRDPPRLCVGDWEPERRTDRHRMTAEGPRA